MIRIVACLLFTMASIAGPVFATEQKEIGSVTVLADAKLAASLSEIASRYVHENMVTISGAYGESGNQTKRIEDGEAADLFITSDASLVEQLKEKGMVDVHTIGRIVSHHETHYTAAVVASENMTAARLFLQYLKSDEAHAIFKKNGLSVP